jgi:hypothetical protein
VVGSVNAIAAQLAFDFAVDLHIHLV